MSMQQAEEMGKIAAVAAAVIAAGLSTASCAL
jgi:hypothetical protein